MIVMQRRTGAPHSVTRPRGAKRAPDPKVEVHREGARARYRCLQRVASRQSGVTSSPLLASKLDVNSRPEGSFFFICVFVFVACAINKRVSQKKKKKKSALGIGVVRAPHAQHASYAPDIWSASKFLPCKPEMPTHCCHTTRRERPNHLRSTAQSCLMCAPGRLNRRSLTHNVGSSNVTMHKTK